PHHEIYTLQWKGYAGYLSGTTIRVVPSAILLYLSVKGSVNIASLRKWPVPLKPFNTCSKM
ncbi:MAG: hypothetical protein ACXWPS_24245, partial [Ktedonobacteraceae bacterium]